MHEDEYLKRLEALEDAMRDHTEVIENVRTLLGQIKDALEPALEKLSNSAIGKMMGL